ncbi:hypothetical protein FS749_015141, partial [Ceratobasidium sp. UAMH 11750]
MEESFTDPNIDPALFDFSFYDPALHDLPFQTDNLDDILGFEPTEPVADAQSNVLGLIGANQASSSSTVLDPQPGQLDATTQPLGGVLFEF